MAPAHDAPDGTPQASPLVAAAQRLAARIETLVDEVSRLRAENTVLRQEVREAVALISAAGGGRRRRRDATEGSVAPKPPVANGRRRRVPGRRPAKTRATPAAVTSDVVRAVIAKLGEATASEIAAEITRAGAPVGGRAIRFLAERAGAQTRIGEDGQRRYHM